MMPCSQCLDEPCSCIHGGRAQFMRETGRAPRPSFSDPIWTVPSDEVRAIAERVLRTWAGMDRQQRETAVSMGLIDAKWLDR
jgi:hypothetical protein